MLSLAMSLTSRLFLLKVAVLTRLMVSRRAIRRFSDEVARRFKPSRIVLFGSYAYGKPTPDSDVDLLVLMPCKGRPLDKSLEIRLAVNAGFPLDLIVRTPAELKKRLAWGDFFLREITEKGTVLYDAAHPGMG